MPRFTASSVRPARVTIACEELWLWIRVQLHRGRILEVMMKSTAKTTWKRLTAALVLSTGLTRCRRRPRRRTRSALCPEGTCSAHPSSAKSKTRAALPSRVPSCTSRTTTASPSAAQSPAKTVPFRFVQMAASTDYEVWGPDRLEEKQNPHHQLFRQPERLQLHAHHRQIGRPVLPARSFQPSQLTDRPPLG